MVVVGLIVEFGEDLRELIVERPFKWKLFRGMVGGLLITVGVAGELLVQFRASRVETELRADSHEVEALLNKQAADANKQAADARRESASASAKPLKPPEMRQWPAAMPSLLNLRRLRRTRVQQKPTGKQKKNALLD